MQRYMLALLDELRIAREMPPITFPMVGDIEPRPLAKAIFVTLRSEEAPRA